MNFANWSCAWSQEMWGNLDVLQHSHSKSCLKCSGVLRQSLCSSITLNVLEQAGLDTEGWSCEGMCKELRPTLSSEGTEGTLL